MVRTFLTHSVSRWLYNHHNKSLHLQTSIPPSRVTALAEIYQHMDADGSGELEIDELQKALEGLCYNEVKAQEILAKFELMDADGSGSIDFEEFAAVMTSEEVSSDEVLSLEDEKDLGLQHQAFYEFATTYRREMLLEEIEGEGPNDVVPYGSFKELFSLQLIADKLRKDEEGRIEGEKKKERMEGWKREVERCNIGARRIREEKEGKRRSAGWTG